jgi:peptidyl-prolyl cis-trans isomerase A (cyclophilin A)
VHPDWAPLGAARFKELIEGNFFKANRFFRVIDSFMAQFGIHANPKLAAEWKTKTMEDDPVKEKNSRGFVSFATSGKNSRTTQMFINFKDNHNLDGMGFSPFAKISSGMDVVDSLFKGYGEGAPSGSGPEQNRIQSEGNRYC